MSVDEPDETDYDTEDSDDRNAPSTSTRKRKLQDPYPGLAVKKRIIDHWVISETERREFPSMKHTFRNMTNNRRNAIIEKGLTQPNTILI